MLSILSRRDFLRRESVTAVGFNSAIAFAASKSSPLPMLPKFPVPPTPEISQRLFPNFETVTVQTSGARIPVLRKGQGPPLLLLHGFPETHVTWHKMAADLARDFEVFIPDLRGYGDASRPSDGDRHTNYSFRAMALDQVETMLYFNHESFYVAAHDRGARVAHRLGLDHPHSVRKLCLMDIAPTLTMYKETDREFATKYVWWFFLIQQEPLPEHLIGLDPAFYLQQTLNALNQTEGAITEDAFKEYLRCFSCVSTIHAVCEDYRASADIDLEIDQADEDAGRKLAMPTHLLWGSKGTVGKRWDMMATWKPKTAAALTGTPLPCGHLLPEEQPEEVTNQLRNFFSRT
jgi:haloacetate dehalogenase